MQEASGSDLKFVMNYVRQRRGMSGVRSMLNVLNQPGILFTGVTDLGVTKYYNEDVYKRLIESAAQILGGDVKQRLNQLGYALGDRAKITKFIAKFSTARQLVRLLEDSIITDIPYVKTSVNEVSKHIVILRIKARNKGEKLLDVCDGYVNAVLDQSNKGLTVAEKKITESDLAYKFVIG